LCNPSMICVSSEASAYDKWSAERLTYQVGKSIMQNWHEPVVLRNNYIHMAFVPMAETDRISD